MSFLSIYSVVAPPLFFAASPIFEQDALQPCCQGFPAVLFVVVARMKMAQKSHFDSDSCLHKSRIGNAKTSNDRKQRWLQKEKKLHKTAYFL
jgi:hypothetical protein